MASTSHWRAGNEEPRATHTQKFRSISESLYRGVTVRRRGERGEECWESAEENRGQGGEGVVGGVLEWSGEAVKEKSKWE